MQDNLTFGGKGCGWLNMDPLIYKMEVYHKMILQGYSAPNISFLAQGRACGFLPLKFNTISSSTYRRAGGAI